MSVAELKERHATATATVNSLREQLRVKRQSLLDTDVARYARNQGRSPVSFNATDLVCCRTLQGHTGKVYALDWTQEKNWIVSASQDGRLIVWNALTSQKTHAIKLNCPWVMTCAFAPNGQSVACGGLDSACSIFNLGSQSDRDGNIPVSRILTGHKGYVSCCQYIPDQETRLITGSGDQTCLLWDVTTGQKISVLGGEFPSGHTSDVLSLSISPSNSDMFVSGSCDSTARLWDVRIASRAVRTFNGHGGDVNTVKFFPDGNRFGTGSDDGSVRLFDMRTGHQLQTYSRQNNADDDETPTVTSVAFSISGRLMFAGYSNGDCCVWDTLLAELQVYERHNSNNDEEEAVTSVAFSISGRLMFAGYSNRDCCIWDTLLAEVVLNLGTLQNSHEGRISCLGLSGDGSALCTGSWDKNLKIWAFGGQRKVI